MIWNKFIDSCTKQKGWKELSFIIRYKLSSEVIGTTRIGDIDTANRNVELGLTWLFHQFGERR